MITVLAVLILILLVVIIGYLINLKGYLAGKFKQKSYAQVQIMRSFDRKNKDILIDKLVLEIKNAQKEAKNDTIQWISKNDFIKMCNTLIQKLKEELNQNEVDAEQ